MELLEILRGAHGGVGGCVSSGRVRAAYSNRPGEKITLAINVIMRLMRRLGAGVPIMTSYANIRVVLVGTTHPGNIGAAARAMKNMCLEHLWLVQPKIFPHAEATARASGADDVLARARVVETLEEALQECVLVVGASARQRTIPWPELDPRACAAAVWNKATHGPVALVFGRENSGLSNAELERCHYLVHIPANPDYSSLNLAAVVQVLTYECLETMLAAIDRRRLLIPWPWSLTSGRRRLRKWRAFSNIWPRRWWNWSSLPRTTRVS